MCYVPRYLRGSRCLGDIQEGSTVFVAEGVSLEASTPEHYGYRTGEARPSFGFLHGFQERPKTERAKLKMQRYPFLTSAQGGLQVGKILVLRGGTLKVCPFREAL